MPQMPPRAARTFLPVPRLAHQCDKWDRSPERSSVDSALARNATISIRAVSLRSTAQYERGLQLVQKHFEKDESKSEKLATEGTEISERVSKDE